MSGDDKDDLEKLKSFLWSYKIPVLLIFIALIFIVSGFVLLLKTSTPHDVVFTQATSSAVMKIKVDIEGAVFYPGVYEFFQGERIADALVKVGGFNQKADRDWASKSLNRAAKLIDGGKIYIPSQGEGKSPAFAQASAGRQNSQGNIILGSSEGTLNLNSASELELDTLPGVGPVTAKKIIEGRPYQTVEELKTKKIVGQALYEKIKTLIAIY